MRQFYVQTNKALPGPRGQWPQAFPTGNFTVLRRSKGGFYEAHWHCCDKVSWHKWETLQKAIDKEYDGCWSCAKQNGRVR